MYKNNNNLKYKMGIIMGMINYCFAIFTINYTVNPLI